ncbi:hypothetical protein [Vibrio metschnikovii]|uniref:hypothetical protein n=1 Tax=Vibrio metschnikovii TaxID=28172 RepID=UPI001C2F4A00|nr:hypothetical protein [Vibrio metschnikovii]
MKSKFMLQPADWPKPLVKRVLHAAKPNLEVFVGTTPEDFVRNLLLSFSLNMSEKVRVIESISGLCQFQVDALIEVFTQEQEKFAKLFDEHPTDVIKLMAHTVVGAFVLAGLVARPFNMEEQIVMSRKMMLRKTKAFDELTPEVRSSLVTAISRNYLLERVLGVLVEPPPPKPGKLVFI